MTIHIQLFEAETIRLAQYNHEADPPVGSRWTHDLNYMRAIEYGLTRPLSPAAIKKQYEQIDKDADQRNQFHFAIRARADDRLMGFAELRWIEWNTGNSFLRLGLGDPADRRQGYGTQALRLMLRYAFHELNLFRVTAVIGSDNPAALGLFGRFGFVEEVRRRQALQRDGQVHDLLMHGLLRSEWEANRK